MKERFFSTPASRIAGSCLFFCFIAVIPLLFQYLQINRGGNYFLDILNNVGLYAILGLSLNIILGQAGLFNMGHAAFFAIGAYTTAILGNMFNLPVFATLPLAGLFAGFFALFIALPIIRLRGDYLLVVTIGVVEIVHLALVNNVFDLTGGANGISVLRPVLFGFRFSKPLHFYYLIWAVVTIAVIFFALIHNSRFGRALAYIKQDELAAAGSGINISKYKLLAFSIGAFWAGMAGTLFAAKMKFISPGTFSFSESVLLFAIVILGGAGSIPGVILGAFLIIGLPELFRDFASARMLVFGAAMVMMMIFRPQGIIAPFKTRYDAKRFIGKFPCAIGSVPKDES